jgi:hypothetical protein
MLPRVGAGVRDLVVVGHRDVRDPAASVGRADRVVHHRRQLRRVVDHLVILGDVGVELVQIDLLLVTGPQQRGLLHAGDREHRHVVELGVVQAVQQVDPARPGRGQANADLAGRLGVGGRHEPAASSWCTSTNRTRSWCLRRPSMSPLMPSPGRPNTVCTPQSAKRSINASAAI